MLLMGYIMSRHVFEMLWIRDALGGIVVGRLRIRQFMEAPMIVTARQRLALDNMNTPPCRPSSDESRVL